MTRPKSDPPNMRAHKGYKRNVPGFVVTGVSVTARIRRWEIELTSEIKITYQCASGVLVSVLVTGSIPKQKGYTHKQKSFGRPMGEKGQCNVCGKREHVAKGGLRTGAYLTASWRKANKGRRSNAFQIAVSENPYPNKSHWPSLVLTEQAVYTMGADDHSIVCVRVFH